MRTPLVHPLFFQEEVAAQLNFPFWFSDSLVRAYGVETITWTVFGSTGADEESQPQEQGEPRSTTVYTFDRNGRLIALEHKTFAEGLTISAIRYAVDPSRGLASGFYPVRRMLSADPDDAGNGRFLCLKQVADRPRIRQYDDEHTDVRYHFFPEKNTAVRCRSTRSGTREAPTGSSGERRSAPLNATRCATL